MAAALKNEPGVEVEVVNGNRGEFSVLVDRKEVARKGESLPSNEEVLTAVRNAQPAGA